VNKAILFQMIAKLVHHLNH